MTAAPEPRRWAAAIAIVGALAAPSPAAAQEVNLIGELSNAAAQQRTEALCEAGDGVRNVDAKVARRLYVRAINTGAARTKCAVDGLAALAEAAKADDAELPTTIDKARALIRNGYADEGDELLRTHLTQQRRAAIPLDLQPDARILEAAEALWAQGYETEAQEQVRAALVADPGRRTIPVELRKAERKPVWLRQAIGWIGAGLVTVALGLGLAYLLVALARAVLLHTRRRIVTEGFEGGPDGTGAAMRAEMEALYHSWTEGQTNEVLRASAGPDQGIKAPSLTQTVPEAGVLLDVLNSLDRGLPNRTWQLAGQFLPAEPEEGVGLALTLYRKSNGKILSSEELREADFQAPPAEDPDDAATKLAYQRLALPCAAFFLYADHDRRWDTRRRDKQYRSLGTKEWRSYAMATSAATYYRSEPDVAKELYRRALALDSDYRDARFGMAVIDLERAEGARSKLAKADQQLVKAGDGLTTEDKLWYRIQFWRVVGFLYRNEHPRAAREAEVLFGDTTHWWSGAALWTGPDRDVRDFLEQHQPNMLAVAATALQCVGPASDGLAARLRAELPGLGQTEVVTGQAIVSAMEADPDKWRASYNLSGYYALAKPSAMWATDSLRHLEAALDTGGATRARYAWGDWFLRSLRTDARARPKFRRLVQDAGFNPLPAGAGSRRRGSASAPRSEASSSA